MNFFYENIKRKIIIMEINWYRHLRLILSRLKKIIDFFFSFWLNIKTIFRSLRSLSEKYSFIDDFTLNCSINFNFFLNFNELRNKNEEKKPIKNILQIVKLHEILFSSYSVAHCAPSMNPTPYHFQNGEKKVAKIHIQIHIHTYTYTNGKKMESKTNNK